MIELYCIILLCTIQLLAKTCTILQKAAAMEKEIIRFNKPGFPIKIHRMRMQADKLYRGIHSHMAVEIVAVKSGALTCRISGNEIVLQSGQILLINSNIGHKLCSSNADIVYMQVDISGYMEGSDGGEFAKLYDFILRVNARPYMVFSRNGELAEILRKIDTKYEEDSASSKWYLKAYLYELVAFLCAHSFVKPVDAFALKIEKIEPAVRYIDENFDQPITLEDICAGAGYNKYALCRTFKAVTGQTVFAYVNFLRIREAVKKLVEKKYTVMEIAAECGFSTAAYFNRVFKSVMGCAPSQYRKYF